ncbi:MAG: hypothetical protein EP334_10000 [Gammaproteobacteria bacterium]|nr:MAG: hypothetical protein EP334_10000 [Gammaproteobacteria bacterium]
MQLIAKCDFVADPHGSVSKGQKFSASEQFGRHLIEIGVAEPCEAKVVQPLEVKSEKEPLAEKKPSAPRSSSASHRGQASRQKTANKSAPAD